MTIASRAGLSLLIFQILHAAIGMAPQIRDAPADEISRPAACQSIVTAIKNAGVFGMAMPRAWGGPELDLLTQFRVLETLGMADGSVGWCAMINCDGGYITAFLDDRSAEHVSGPAVGRPRRQHQVVRPYGYRAVIASAGVFHSPVAVSIANGSGWAARS